MKLFVDQRPGSIATLLGSLVLVCVLGCEQTPEVIQYRIPTNMPTALQAEQDRMLAAMVPVGEDVWFYKLTGPQTAVDSVASPFETFVQDLVYDVDGPKLDSLPDGWRRGGKRAFRFATVDVPTIGVDGEDGKQLDISISKLGKQEDYQAMVAMNVNRWRGQLGLKPSDEQLAGATKIDVKAADDDSMWVDLIGESSGATPPMMAGGFRDGDQMKMAGGKPNPTPTKMSANQDSGSPNSSKPNSGDGSDPADRTTAGQPVPVQFETPDGWRPGRTSSMRLASFNVGPEDSAAEITVIPAGGDLRSNVARWIEQIIGEAPDPKVVDKALADAQTLAVDERSGQRFYLTGDDDAGKAIDASIIDLGDGYSLFVKMTGPAKTVSQQRDRIGAFLDSMKINL